MSDVKKKVVILFGGQSSEHDVSCISGATVAEAVDKDKYEVYLLGITKEGRWVLVDSVEDIRSGAWRESGREALIAPSSDRRMLVKDGDSYTEITVDVVFPVLHGLYGEDGTVQGLLKLAHIPFAGCGHLSAAITMDKFFTKVIADSVGVAQAAYEPVRDYELKDMDSVVARVEAFRDYPVFIKPSNAGSSVGITKAHNREELIKGLKLAAENDSKILVEEAINGREIECAVYGYGDNAVAMGLGEIVAAAEFYDFDAKYNNAESKTLIDPDMPEDKKQRLAIIREALRHNRMFPEKVIKYLWDDALKFNPEALFDTDNMESLEQVIRTFVYSMGRERFKIFKPTVRASLYPDSQA